MGVVDPFSACLMAAINNSRATVVTVWPASLAIRSRDEAVLRSSLIPSWVMYFSDINQRMEK